MPTALEHVHRCAAVDHVGSDPTSTSRRRPLLLVFVDGLPFADHGGVLPRGWHAAPMIPGLGYSVNIKAELFAGATAADLGWFCEWSPGERRPVIERALARAASLFAGNDHLDWLAHRVLERAIRERLYNVPLQCLHGLHHTGKAAYSDGFDVPTVFDRTAIDRVSYDGAPAGGHDARVLTEAHARLDRGASRIFVPLVDLDGDTHQVGLGGTTRIERLRGLRTGIADLWTHALERDGDTVGVLVSDHGLVDVTDGVDLDLRGLLGRLPRGRRALYTLEATLARVWSDDPTVVRGVERELDGIGAGRVLSTSERTTWGLDDRRFGDVIFLLEEGRMFVPNTMTKRTLARAMHGYDPAHPSQWGVAASSVPLFDGPQRPLDVHAVLERS